MGNTDFRVQLSFFTHHKRRKLEKRLGKGACFCLLELWAFVSDSKPNGVLGGMQSDDIEVAADWDGEPGKFIEALVDLRLLDFDGEIYRVHDWKEHNPYASDSEVRSCQAAHATACRDADKKQLEGSERHQFLSERLSRFNPEISGRYLSDKRGISQGLSPSPSPSPSPEPSPKESFPAPASAGTGNGSEKPLRKSKPLRESDQTTPHGIALKYFCQCFYDRFATDCEVGGEGQTTFRRWLVNGKLTPEKLKAAIDEWFSREPDRYNGNLRLKNFIGQIDSVIVEMGKGRPKTKIIYDPIKGPVEVKTR